MSPKSNPRFPLYIPSKGRFEPKLRMTSNVLSTMGVPHRIVVESQEYSSYRDAGVPTSRLLVLDTAYRTRYETLDDLGDSKSYGPGPARNFIWDHAKDEGHEWHWVMDDNIRGFYRMDNNKRLRVGDGTCFRVMEDFVLRYKNIGMAGPAYRFFCAPRFKHPPFVLNTRIYSCNLIRNDVQQRWRGRYNEDTILSLDMLKARLCTVQFKVFLQDKVATQTAKGGNTDAFYDKEGTYAKTEMLVHAHPDVARMVWKYSRVHHEVDYRKWKHMPLVRRTDIQIPTGVNDYGMSIRKKNR